MQIRKNLPFFNVVATGTASLSVELGMSIARIVLVLGGTAFTKSMITKIRCKLNGKIFYEITGARLDSLNQYKGLYADATHLTIDFSEQSMKDVGGMLAGIIGTRSGVNDLTIEVDISGATAPTLASYRMETAPMDLGLVTCLLPFVNNYAAGGKYAIILPYGQQTGHLLKRVAFFHANITDVEVKKNGLSVYEQLPTADINFITQEYKNTPQSGLYVYDRLIEDDIKQVLRTDDAQSLQFLVNLSAADTVNTYFDGLAILGNI